MERDKGLKMKDYTETIETILASLKKRKTNKAIRAGLEVVTTVIAAQQVRELGRIADALEKKKIKPKRPHFVPFLSRRGSY